MEIFIRLTISNFLYIIVLLILAAVTISLVLGQNGIIGKANQAKTITPQKEAEEAIKLVLGEWKIEKYTGTMTLKEFLESKVPNELDSVTGEEAPFEVEKNGYVGAVNADGLLDGEVQKAGPRPEVNETSITITLEDGNTIPDDRVDEGTKLKISFTTSIEGGTITEVIPGELSNGYVTYTTTGTEKEVKFTITGKVNEESYKIEKTISLKEYYKKSEVEAVDIAKEPLTYYGAEVTGYTCSSDGVSKWRIFYADSSNIYLIADDYIDYTKAPDGKLGNKIYKNSTNYELSFNNVYKDYKGSEWILGKTTVDDVEIENSKAKKWLNKYFNYTPDNGITYPNETNENINIRAVAYMMDTNIWSEYAGEKAEYAIGGPTLEMFCESYVQTHPYYAFDISVEGDVGYSNAEVSGIGSDFNEIYIKSSGDKKAKANGMFLASPSDARGDILVNTYYNNRLGWSRYNITDLGLCPLVCLKSDVKLEKVPEVEGTYKIVEQK